LDDFDGPCLKGRRLWSTLSISEVSEAKENEQKKKKFIVLFFLFKIFINF